MKNQEGWRPKGTPQFAFAESLREHIRDLNSMRGRTRAQAFSCTITVDFLRHRGFAEDPAKLDPNGHAELRELITSHFKGFTVGEINPVCRTAPSMMEEWFAIITVT